MEQAVVRYRSTQAGPVRLAHDQAQDRDVRLVMVPDQGTDPGRQADLHDRLRTLEQVQLPRVVPVLEVVQQDGGTWAVTPLPPGRPLHQLADQPLDRPALAADLVGALTALHELGVAHGAVGPTSCRVAPNGAGLDVPALAPGNGQSAAADRAALATVLEALVDEPDGAVAALVRELRAAPTARPAAQAAQLAVAPTRPPALDRPSTPDRSPALDRSSAPDRSPGSADVQPVADRSQPPSTSPSPSMSPSPVEAEALHRVDRPARPEPVGGGWRRRPLLEGLALALVALISLLALLLVL